MTDSGVIGPLLTGASGVGFLVGEPWWRSSASRRAYGRRRNRCPARSRGRTVGARARSLAYGRPRPGLIWISRHQAMSVNTTTSTTCMPMAISQAEGLGAQSGSVLLPGGKIALRLTVDAVAAKPQRAGAR